MFETAFIKRYLTPKKKQLSSSLIALLSVAVITLVVWLVVLFLSVTEGIERNWLDKLTSLNAPVRIKPTEAYFSSYYYNVDQYSSASHYLSKSLGEKARSLISDPYDTEFDESLPYSIGRPDRRADGSLIDPVKELTAGLGDLNLTYQDVEMSGALMRLELIRQEAGSLNPAEVKSQLTNVSYLASFPSSNPTLKNLLLEPTAEDLNHLLFMSTRSKKESPNWLEHLDVHAASPSSDLWRVPTQMLPEKSPLAVRAYQHGGAISHVLIPTSVEGPTGETVERRGERLFYKQGTEPEIPLDVEVPLFTMGTLDLNVSEVQEGLRLIVSGTLQGAKASGVVPFEGLKLTEAAVSREIKGIKEPKAIWPYFDGQGVAHLPSDGTHSGILLSKSYQENGVRLGDRGYLAYSAPSISGAKELQVPVFIAGFYDPGIMAVGNKCILVPPHITQTINRTESPYTLERSEANAFFVWLPKLQDAPKAKVEILNMLEKKGISKYWRVETFHDYEFAKPLMQQFQSDKYLFTIIGVIILLVACTNIISLLILLVSDKKKEIGILRAMGAKRRSIAAIFACSGGFLGLLSCLLGLFLAWITLKNIDAVVHLLSILQGHEAFNASFFGTALPNTISPRALWFAAIATPILALISGLVPAIKAARLDPCKALRSE